MEPGGIAQKDCRQDVKDHNVPGAREKRCYEAYPMVNCDEPEAVLGTSLAYTV
jgi:hypothetical protein